MMAHYGGPRMQHTYFVLHFVLHLTTRGGTNPDGVEMTLIRERKSTHRLGTRLESHRKNTRPGHNIVSDTTTTEGTGIPRPGTLFRVQRYVCNSGALKVGKFPVTSPCRPGGPVGHDLSS